MFVGLGHGGFERVVDGSADVGLRIEDSFVGIVAGGVVVMFRCGGCVRSMWARIGPIGLFFKQI